MFNSWSSKPCCGSIYWRADSNNTSAFVFLLTYQYLCSTSTMIVSMSNVIRSVCMQMRIQKGSSTASAGALLLSWQSSLINTNIVCKVATSVAQCSQCNKYMKRAFKALALDSGPWLVPESRSCSTSALPQFKSAWPLHSLHQYMF